MVMKTHDRNSRPVRLQPRALRVRWPPIPGGRGLTYILYHIARCEIPSQTYYPLRSEACFLLECGVRSTITPSQEAHADFYAPACVTPPHQLRLCACYFTHSPNITVMDWTGHRQTFFFFFFFYKYTFRSIAGRDIHLHPQSTPFDDRRRPCLLQCLHFGLGLARPRWISPPFFRSHPLSALLPTTETFSSTRHDRYRSLLHPFTTPPLSNQQPGQPQLFEPPNESRLGCLDKVLHMCTCSAPQFPSRFSRETTLEIFFFDFYSLFHFITIQGGDDKGL